MPIEITNPPDAHDAMSEADNHTLIDVRTVAEFDAGHPAGAVNIPFAFTGPEGMAPNPDFVPTVRKHFPKDRKLFLSCKMGGRSLAACQVLLDAGYGTLVNIDGGFDGRAEIVGWKASGLPVETSASTWDQLKG